MYVKDEGRFLEAEGLATMSGRRFGDYVRARGVRLVGGEIRLRRKEDCRRIEV
jgi:hypothetical protein